jgi:2'-phosphotransferase
VPETVVHGTYFTFWPAIVESGGLKPGSRNHVHCSVGLPGEGVGEDGKPAVVSGMRNDAELLIFVDVERCIRETGMRWWLSDNGVVLTAGDDEGGVVPLRFFREVVGRREGVGVLWRDGSKVADLPPGIKGRVPRGKRGAGGWGRGRGR